MILKELSISQCLYEKSVSHRNFSLQNVEKLCCENIVNVHRSLRILYYCAPTAKSCVLFLQNHGSSLPLSLSYTLRKYQKASEFLFFQDKQKGIIDLKWFTFNRFLFHLTYSADQEFFRFPINSVDSLLTHLETASLSNFASNLK